MIIGKKYFSMNGGLPRGTSCPDNHIGIGSKTSKGVHIWIGHTVESCEEDDSYFRSYSVHLNKKETRDLIEELICRTFGIEVDIEDIIIEALVKKKC